MSLKKFPLSFQWPTFEPFLFCVHHLDYYPIGNSDFAPDKKYLEGRNIGEDFMVKDGFRMYHGNSVPGFPAHPHRGFETITIVRKGYVDHADSLGAAGRYGEGDVQWMTAGKGIQHSEMFPLLKQNSENTVELFQIWLNLPKKNKMVNPYFTMHWADSIPQIIEKEGKVQVTLIAGEYAGKKALPPPPDSWASQEEGSVQILLVKIKAGEEFELSGLSGQVTRTVYSFGSFDLTINNEILESKSGCVFESGEALCIVASGGNAEFLILQAKPIGEPIAQHGPFVMNTREEIYATFEEYRRTQFGGWPWPRADMVHGPEIRKFAKFLDGRVEQR